MENKLIIIFVSVLLLSCTSSPQLPVTSKDSTGYGLNLPEGFSISLFAENLGKGLLAYPGPNPGPRFMAVHENVLFVTIPNKGMVVGLPDDDQNGKADELIVVIDGLNKPHGIDFHDGWTYIAETDKVIRFKKDENHQFIEGTKEVLVDDIPTGGHWTRTIQIHDNKLYLSVGSSCNTCYEEHPWRAAITRCNLDGSNCEVFATGLRNSVGFIFVENEIYATDNGRDWLGDDAPPEDINLVQEGKDYGWPICYGNKIHDTEFDKNVYARNPCEDTEAPLIEMQAHSAPLGLAHYGGQTYPGQYHENLFIAFHGSWNREEKTGYKVVRANLDTGEVHDFITGWLKEGKEVVGRPVDIVFDGGENMYISDDNAGVIYKVVYTG